VRQEKRKLTDLSEFLDRLGWAVCPEKVLEYMREQRRCPTGIKQLLGTIPNDKKNEV